MSKTTIINTDEEWCQILGPLVDDDNRTKYPFKEDVDKHSLFQEAKACLEATATAGFTVDETAFNTFYCVYACDAINTLRLAFGLKGQFSLGQRRLFTDMKVVDLAEKLNVIRKALCQVLFKYVDTALASEKGLDSIRVPSIALSNIMYAGMFYDQQNAVDFLQGKSDSPNGLLWISKENLLKLKNVSVTTRSLYELIHRQDSGTLDKHYVMLQRHFEQKYNYRIVSADVFDVKLPRSLPEFAEAEDELDFIMKELAKDEVKKDS
jgi:hypothetical protein